MAHGLADWMDTPGCIIQVRSLISGIKPLGMMLCDVLNITIGPVVRRERSGILLPIAIHRPTRCAYYRSVPAIKYPSLSCLSIGLYALQLLLFLPYSSHLLYPRFILSFVS